MIVIAAVSIVVMAFLFIAMARMPTSNNKPPIQHGPAVTIIDFDYFDAIIEMSNEGLPIPDGYEVHRFFNGDEYTIHVSGKYNYTRTNMKWRVGI